MAYAVVTRAVQTMCAIRGLRQEQMFVEATIAQVESGANLSGRAISEIDRDETRQRRLEHQRTSDRE
jgi:hypothetical protein